MASFESVADEYDRARPSYPDELFGSFGPITGLRVLDVGAGTGIATRVLMARQANVVAIDSGREVLRRATARTPGLAAVVADGAVLPVRSNTVDLVCFAQSWHWLNETTRVAEAHRVLRAGGRWAGWWSHARDDGQHWFDAYWNAIEHSCPGTNRGQRDTDWGLTIAVPGSFVVTDRVTVPWVRKISIDDWLTDQTSHSYIAALPAGPRARLLTELRAILSDQFADGFVTVPYETWLWIAARI